MKKIIIYIDGGSRGNPGDAAIGVLFCNEKGICFKKFSQYLGKMTNNEAEYEAAIFALNKFKKLFGKKLAKETEIEIRSDSALLINQINGKYKILENNLQREKNKEADQLVNQVLDALKKPLFSS
jgi:ribonuclease HI